MTHENTSPTSRFDRLNNRTLGIVRLPQVAPEESVTITEPPHQHIRDDIEYALKYATNVARRYWQRLPFEDRVIHAVGDLAGDYITHLLSKEHKYNPERDLRPWVRTVIYNRALTLTNKIWVERRRNIGDADLGVDTGSVTVAYESGDEDRAEIIFADNVTPELLVSLTDEESKKMAEKVSATVKEIEDLCGTFGKDFTADDVNGSLEGVLEHVLNTMSDDDFQKLDEAVQARVQELGEAFEAKTLAITKGKSKGKGKGSGTPGRRNPDGPVAKIRENFAAGIQTVPEMEIKLKEAGVEFSSNTVKTQVGKLRKEAGLTNGRRGRSPSGSGVLHEIRVAFNEKGLKTVAEVTKFLESKELDFSPATVKTQVGRLRKEEGLTNKPEPKKDAAPADDKGKSNGKDTAKKAGAKKAGAKKTGAKKTGAKTADDTKADTPPADKPAPRRRRRAAA